MIVASIFVTTSHERFAGWRPHTVTHRRDRVATLTTTARAGGAAFKPGARVTPAVPHSTYDHDVDVRYRDLDPREHVNHAVYVSYLEQAKGAFFLDVLGTSLADADTAVRTLELDYLAPIVADGTVRVALGPVDPGETSYTIGYEIADDGDVAATARTISVLLDGSGNPRALPDEWHERMAPYASDG